MRQRIAALAPEAGVWVGTFHSLCARLLRTYAPLVGIDRGFTIYDQADRLRAVKQVMERLDLDSVTITPERIDAVDQPRQERPGRPRGPRQAGTRPRRCRRRQGLSRLPGAAPRVVGRRFRRPARPPRHDPQGAPGRPRRARRAVPLRPGRRVPGHQPGAVRDRPRPVGPTTPTSASPATPTSRSTAGGARTSSNILEFEHDFPGCRVVKLERNYRSTKNILRVADHLIRFNRRRKPKALTTENPSGAPVELTIYATETDEARGVASKIVELVHEGDSAYGDVAVFCRVTALTRNLESALRAAKVPYQVVGGVSFYERQEVKDVLAYLSLMANPKDDLAFSRVVNVPPRGLGKTSLDHLAERARALGLPLLAMARQASAIPGLKDRAARAPPRLRAADGRAGGPPRPLRRGGHPQAPGPDRLSRLPGRRRQGRTARTGWRTSTSSSRRPASSTASTRAPPCSSSWRRSAWPRPSIAGRTRPARSR